jgi:methenyltetrahydromethanopterin cyclohydrolase
VSLSGRAMACSARRAGWQPIVIDGFADADTLQASSHCMRLSIRDGRFDARKLLTSLQSLGFGKQRLPMVYGAGFESDSALLRRLAEVCTVYGNSPDTVRKVNDPICFFELLDDLAIRHPEVRFLPPGDEEGWLMKRSGASGGGHVRRWSFGRRWSREHYFQRRVPGTAMSVLFLSCDGKSRIIGFNTQWACARDADSPYHFAGAINRAAALSADQVKRVESYVVRLSRALALRGLNSLDFVLAQGEPAVLEINSRPSATFELYEQDLHEGLLYWHVQACQGKLPSLNRSPARRVRALAIVYAPQTLRNVPGIHWPSWSADRPTCGSRVRAGEPLCSVSAEGTSQHEVKRRVFKRKLTVLQSLYSFCRAA